MFGTPTVPSDIEWREHVNFEQRNLKSAALFLSSGTGRRSYADLLLGNFSSDDLIFILLEDQIANLTDLTGGWDSYDAPAPSVETINGARRAMEKLRAEQLAPESVTPSAEGGVSIYFSRGEQKAFIEFLNEGDVLFARYSKDDEPNVKVLRNGLQDFNDQALQEIRDHLGARA